MANIIIKDRPHRFGKTRTEMDKNLKSEGWGTSFRDKRDADKCKYLEKKFLGEFTTGGECKPRGSDIHGCVR
jgi:hypothetical protein